MDRHPCPPQLGGGVLPAGRPDWFGRIAGIFLKSCTAAAKRRDRTSNAMSEDFAFDRAFLFAAPDKGGGSDASVFVSFQYFCNFSNLGLQFSNDLLYCTLQQILK